MVMELGIVVLRVRDWYRAVDWYRDVLGLTELYREEATQWAEFEVGPVHLAVEALYDAADEDTGTGGPDFVRRIFPNVKLVTRAGIQEISDDRVAAVCEAIVNARRSTPG